MVVSLVYRMLTDLEATGDPEQHFAFMTNEVTTIGSQLVGHEARISVLERDLKFTQCLAAEEYCGRINEDNQNRLLIFGGPHIPFDAHFQQNLRAQVY